MMHEMECRDGIAVVSLNGRMTFADHQGVCALLADLRRTGARRWRFDLSGLQFVDSAAVIMLMVAREAAAEAGAGIEFRGASTCVQRICAATGFTALLRAERDAAPAPWAALAPRQIGIPLMG